MPGMPTMEKEEIVRGVSAIKDRVDLYRGQVASYFEHWINQTLDGQELFQQVNREYFLRGKKLRPGLALVMYYIESIVKFDKTDPDGVSNLLSWRKPSPNLLTMAVGFEGIHQASVTIDDALDGSMYRRGVETPRAVLCLEDCIRLGEFILSKVLNLTEERDLNKYRRQQMNDIRLSLIEGETRESNLRKKLGEGAYGLKPNEKNIAKIQLEYDAIINSKTARFLELVSLIGAEYGGSDDDGGLSKERKVLYELFGWRIGRLYQFVDDTLDVNGNNSGKPVGLDIANGTMNIVHIMALQNPKTPSKSKDMLFRTIVDKDYRGEGVESKRVQKANKIVLDYGLGPLEDLIGREILRVNDLMNEISQGNQIAYAMLGAIVDKTVRRDK